MTLDVNGKNYSVTGQGQGNLNTVLGSLGAASFLGLGANGCGNGILGGMFGGNRCDNYVTEKNRILLSRWLRHKARTLRSLSHVKKTLKSSTKHAGQTTSWPQFWKKQTLA